MLLNQLLFIFKGISQITDGIIDDNFFEKNKVPDIKK